jgi:hypothetical protein
MSRRGASIDLKDVQEMNLYPEEFTGNWSEASNILAKHFGKVSRIMSRNRGRLHDLYKAALKELQEV